MTKFKKICVFCGSNGGTDPEFMESAEEAGRFLAANGVGLVFGGGRVGLMGKIADTVMECGGNVTGIIPRALAEKEVAHEHLTELHIVKSMHERKAMMADFADGFIAMPGGFGTFEEICEVITWTQLGFQEKPCGILNINGYYDDLISLFDKATEKGFIRPVHRKLVIVGNTIEELFEKMLEFEPSELEKWIDKETI